MDGKDGGSRACDICGNMIRIAVPRAFSVKANDPRARGGTPADVVPRTPTGPGKHARHGVIGPHPRRPAALRFRRFSALITKTQQPHDGTLDG
jgi:hypothetical protein